MKKESIKSHLSPYSIWQKRRTTIHHAFASALAPCSVYDETVIDAAIRVLGQNPYSDLTCVYCEDPAKTWDHLIGLVQNSELRGFGHQLGNLVPSCQTCNSRKGSKDWRTFVETATDANYRSLRISRIERYLSEFASPVDLSRVQREAPELWSEYSRLKGQILALMTEADELAKKLRPFTIVSGQRSKA